MQYIITPNNVITIILDDYGHFVLPESHPNNAEIQDAIRKNADEDEIYELIDTIPESVNVSGDLVIENRRIMFNGQVLNNTLCRRLLGMRNQGYDTRPITYFLENILCNPDPRCVNFTYDFMEFNNLPVTESGHFVAYKMVTGDFKDLWTRTIDNRPGSRVTQPRWMCDSNPNVACSKGLHVAGYDFVKSYGGERLISVQVNPEHVVSVPYKYDMGKMRVCEYIVLEELTTEWKEDILAKHALYPSR